MNYVIFDNCKLCDDVTSFVTNFFYLQLYHIWYAQILRREHIFLI